MNELNHFAAGFAVVLVNGAKMISMNNDLQLVVDSDTRILAVWSKNRQLGFFNQIDAAFKHLDRLIELNPKLEGSLGVTPVVWTPLSNYSSIIRSLET